MDGKPVKPPYSDKIAAAKELVRVCGWAKADRVELSATDTLADFISSIRRAERPRHPVMENHAEANRGSAYAPLQETKSTVL